MLVAFSFFCCCLILLWFCTLPALLVFVVLLAVLFCLILRLLVLPFSEIFGFVLFCFVFFNFDVISQPYFHKLFSVFLVLFSFVIFCYYFFYFVVISQPCMLSRHVRQQKNLQTACCCFFLFNSILHGQIWLFCAHKGIRLKKLGTKSVSY